MPNRFHDAGHGPAVAVGIDQPAQRFTKLRRQSSFRRRNDRPAGVVGVPASGPIALQSHGCPVEFENVFVRPLK